MNFKLKLCALTLVVCMCASVAADEAKVESSTASPLMDIIDTKTEKPPIAKMDEKSEQAADAPVRTVGDFIIHPLVAFRPRPAAKKDDGNDAPAAKQADGSSTTTPAPWPVIGLGYGQAIGSQVSNLAGQISGWINDRIQLPGIVDTPVRDSSTTTTTTTTPRPDVIVRVHHRPSISFNDNRKQRPNKVNEVEPESQEQEYEQDEADEVEEDEYYGGHDDEEEYEEEQEFVRPINRRRPVRKQQQRRPQRIRTQHVRHPLNNNKRRQQFNNNNRFDDYAEDDSDDDYYYQFSDKRSQQNNLMQLGQQGILNHIRLLTRGQTPAQIGNAIRQTNPERHQATFLVKRNGETVYLSPELLGEEEEQKPTYQFIAQTAAKEPTHQYPQPPLTTPLKINGQIQQYITIPYNQLGIVPPQGAISVAEGLQQQPLIFSIPQSTFQKLQSNDKNHGPLLTANAVPLLAESSLADIFKPPQIPPSRTVTAAPVQNAKPLTATYTPVVVLTQNGSHKIRGGTIVEKSPPSVNYQKVKTEEAYIVVNDDNEASTRQAKPKPGKARLYQLPKGGRFAVRNGRSLDQSHSPAKEEHIPVAIVEVAAEPAKVEIISAVPETAPEVVLAATPKDIETPAVPSAATPKEIETPAARSFDIEKEIETTTVHSAKIEKEIETPVMHSAEIVTPAVPSAAIEKEIESPGVPSAAIEKEIETPAVPSAAIEKEIESSAVPSAEIEKTIETPSGRSVDIEKEIETPAVHSAEIEKEIETPAVPSVAIEKEIETMLKETVEKQKEVTEETAVTPEAIKTDVAAADPVDETQKPAEQMA